MVSKSRPLTPLLAVDVIIRMLDRSEPSIVLIQRRNPPVGWALPGGFVEIGEDVGTAATRESREETGLEVVLTELAGCYSRPDRDPRGHCVSVVFTAESRGEPRGGDDAACAQVFTLEALPEPLAFDHAQIINDYLAGRRGVWR